MKQFLTTTYALAFTAICCLLASCGETKTIEHENQPVVEITLLDTSYPDHVTVQFKANSTTTRYNYAIGTAADKESFLDGTIPGKVTVASNETKEVKFEGLDPDTKYIVYAMGFNSTNDQGPLAMATAGTYTDAFTAELSYASDISAGIKLDASYDIYKCKYFLGSPEQKEAFLNDEEELDIKFKSETFDWSENYFDLVPEKEYVFYAIGYYRNGTETRLFEVPFKTAALNSNEIPNVTLEMGEKDFYTQNYTVTPNSKCGKIVFYQKRTQDYEDVLYNKNNYAGNLMEMLYEFQGRTPEQVSEASKVYVATGKTLEAMTSIKEFSLDEPLDIYIQIYNENLEPVSVKKYNATSHKLDVKIPTPKASDFDVKINSVDPDTQTINLSISFKGTNCHGYLFEILDKAWVDKDVLKPGADPYLVHDLLYSHMTSSAGFVYKKNDLLNTPFTDKQLTPNKSYYLGICPMNANGPIKGGWGELILTEFNTNVAE